MADNYIGEIRSVGFNFAPDGWAFCNGAIISISGNDALFALIGTTYGGDGVTTFGLPDLRGRAPVGQGNGPGLSPRVMGQQYGQENVTLDTNTTAPHTHPLMASTTGAASNLPTNNLLAPTSPDFYSDAPPSGSTLAPVTIAPAGGTASHNNLQPLQVQNYIIALQGIFPSAS